MARRGRTGMSSGRNSIGRRSIGHRHAIHHRHRNHGSSFRNRGSFFRNRHNSRAGSLGHNNAPVTINGTVMSGVMKCVLMVVVYLIPFITLAIGAILFGITFTKTGIILMAVGGGLFFFTTCAVMLCCCFQTQTQQVTTTEQTNASVVNTIPPLDGIQYSQYGVSDGPPGYNEVQAFPQTTTTSYSMTPQYQAPYADGPTYAVYNQQAGSAAPPYSAPSLA